MRESEIKQEVSGNTHMLVKLILLMRLPITEGRRSVPSAATSNDFLLTGEDWTSLSVCVFSR